MTKDWLITFTQLLMSAAEIQNVLYVGESALADIRDIAPKSYWTAICPDVPGDFAPFKRYNDFALDSMQDIPWEIYFDFDLTFLTGLRGDRQSFLNIYKKAINNSRFVVMQCDELPFDLFELDDMQIRNETRDIYVAAKSGQDKDILEKVAQHL